MLEVHKSAPDTPETVTRYGGRCSSWQYRSVVDIQPVGGAGAAFPLRPGGLDRSACSSFAGAWANRLKPLTRVHSHVCLLRLKQACQKYVET